MHRPEAGSQPRLRLAEARTLEGWSQHEVADRIGTTHVNISRWERGITRPNPYFRRKLCALFGKTEEELDLAQTAKAAETPVSAPTLPGTSLYDPAIPLQPATRLVGRNEELTRIKNRLRAGGSVALTALNGLPGVGKTALAIALAHDAELREHFHDGVLWAGLGPTPNMPGLLSRWGTLLGISTNEMGAFKSNEDWAKALRNAIGARSLLLVIDDVWHIEDALTFNVGGEHCAHLITTRFPGIAAHIANEGATVISELSENESITLLRMLAPSVVDREEQMAHDLVQAVGGLPLALKLMGNYLRKQAYGGQSRRIHGALERLSDAGERLQVSEPHTPVESHPSLPVDTPLSLQSVIAVTDHQLDRQASTALYALAVFPPKPDSFSEEAALAVTASPVDILDSLVDAGLLESNVSGRYTLHQTIADYARLHLREDAPGERLITYIAHYVESHRKDYELLELESNIILTALEMAHERGKLAELIRIVNAYTPFLLLRGLYSLAEQQVQRAHEAAASLGDRRGLTSTYLHLGEIAQKQGNYPLAETHFQQGLTLARQLQDPERISALLTGLGTVSWKRGANSQAEVYLQEGLALARQLEDIERITGLLKILGSVVGSRGDFTQAEIYLREGLMLARQLGDREQMCIVLMNLGAAAGGKGNHLQAESYFQEGLGLARQIGDRERMSALLSNLGHAAGEQGNYAQAEIYFREGLQLARQLGHREWSSALLINLGLVTRKQGNYIGAKSYFQESLTFAKQIGRAQITCGALYEYGMLYLDMQELEAAEITFQEMLAIIPEGDQELLALAQYGLARTAAAQENYIKAQRLGEASVTVLESIGHHKMQEVKNWLGSVMNETRD